MSGESAAGGALGRALELTRDVTPLRQDCGRHCGAACCRDDGEDELGMLLFPGEEGLYGEQDAAWMHIVSSGEEREGLGVPLLVCNGTCPRERRPLACRIFPLGPKTGKGPPRVRIDPRSRMMCPLADAGIQGLSPDFVKAVGEAFLALWEDEEQREYLRWLSALIDAYGRMIRAFLGS